MANWQLIPEEVRLPEGEGEGYIVAIVTDNESIKVRQKFPLQSLDDLTTAGRNTVRRFQAQLFAKTIQVGVPIDVTPPDQPVLTPEEQQQRDDFIALLTVFRRSQRVRMAGLEPDVDESALVAALQAAIDKMPALEALL